MDQFPKDFIVEMVKEMKLPVEFQDMMDAEKDKPLWGINLPALDDDKIYTGSTDVGDVSLITPLSMLNTACDPLQHPVTIGIHSRMWFNPSGTKA